MVEAKKASKPWKTSNMRIRRKKIPSQMWQKKAIFLFRLKFNLKIASKRERCTESLFMFRSSDLCQWSNVWKITGR